MSTREAEPSDGPSTRVHLRRGLPARCELLLVPHVPESGYAFTLMTVDSYPDDPEHSLRASLEMLPAHAHAAMVAEQAARLSNRKQLAKLGGRELEIVTELVAGKRVPAIARKLFLSEGTVRNHLSGAYRKLGVTNQQELIDLFH